MLFRSAKDKATLVMEALSVKSVTLTVEVDSLKLKLEEKESKINALKSELAEVRLENYKSILRDFDGLSRIGKIRFLTTIIDGRPIKDAHQNIHLKAGA